MVNNVTILVCLVGWFELVNVYLYAVDYQKLPTLNNDAMKKDEKPCMSQSDTWLLIYGRKKAK